MNKLTKIIIILAVCSTFASLMLVLYSSYKRFQRSDFGLTYQGYVTEESGEFLIIESFKKTQKFKITERTQVYEVFFSDNQFVHKISQTHISDHGIQPSRLIGYTVQVVSDFPSLEVAQAKKITILHVTDQKTNENNTQNNTFYKRHLPDIPILP